MDTDPLHRDAYAVRRAIEVCHGDLGAGFSCFPRGCCGDVSQLLAAFLESQGHGTFDYICGLRFEEDGPPSSHAWLKRGGLIIDITRDQFDPGLGPVFVAADSSWHDDWFPSRDPHGPGEWTLELHSVYARIQLELKSGSGTA
ncbi:hypothetical protein FHS00_001344 [Limimaricola variabilis]|uniref:Microcin J25-processing protein McjB C-terminal domain-containing protein n=1 Tax=Limimaricola variabilis TaxID=1492771 RepID=A0ABR6HMV1_9RHOB|nr:hypothetical protein [Limimaricola variabilis]MBB3711773.1 hypothetical protein [Limimaricola variabilis]